MLTDVEREHLFLIGLGRPPEVRYQASEGVSPRLQRVLDALETSPAIIRTAIWDVVAWNRAATLVLTDYSKLPPEQRNILRLIFCEPRRPGRAVRLGQRGALRGRGVPGRCGARRRGLACRRLRRRAVPPQPRIREAVADNDVRNYGEGVKHLRHPVLGPIAFEYSAFAVDGRPDLGMVVYNPATPEDAERIRNVLATHID